MQITNDQIDTYIHSISEPRLNDILKLVDLFKKLTQKEPKLWGTIIGFGHLHYRYKTGNEGDMPLIGLSNRKEAITLYLSYTLDQYPQLSSLGKFKIGKSCLYIKKLSDIHIDVLESLIKDAIKDTLSISFITDKER